MADRPLVMCRSAVPPEPIDPSYTLGYKCANCDKPLQVSQRGVAVLREHDGVPLCNRCGNEAVQMVKAAIEAGNDKIQMDILFGPDAQKTIEKRTGKDILEHIPEAETTPLDPAAYIRRNAGKA